MIRKIAIAGLGSALLASLPAHAQEMPELEGAPPPLNIPRTSTPKPKIVAPAPKPAAPKVVQPVATAKQVEAMKAERVALDKRAAELKTQQAGLDARAADLAAREKQLAEQGARQQEELAAQRADLKRQREALDKQMADVSARGAQVAERDPLPEVSKKTATPPRRDADGGLNLVAARKSCMLAAEDAAERRNFYSVTYDEAPYFFQTRTLQLRGAMRVEDRRGYMILDTVCEVDRDGEALNFAFLR